MSGPAAFLGRVRRALARRARALLAPAPEPPYPPLALGLDSPHVLEATGEAQTALVAELWARYLAERSRWASLPPAARRDWAYALNWMGIYLQQLAEDAKVEMHPEQRPARDGTRLALAADVHRELHAQYTGYAGYKYFSGLPYQGLGIAGVFGNRESALRYEVYGLGRYLRPESTILDIGASCGFLSIYAAFRTGCRAECIEHNPHMVEIGRAVARHLGVDDRVVFHAARFQDLALAERVYSHVFSFAAHWTDDEGLRVDLGAHLRRLASLLADGGALFFESHSADIGDATFEGTMREAALTAFRVLERRLLEAGTREFFVLGKR